MKANTPRAATGSPTSTIALAVSRRVHRPVASRSSCRGRTARCSRISTAPQPSAGRLFYEPAGQIKHVAPALGGIRAGHLSRCRSSLKREIDIFRSVVGPDTEAFITTTAPASLEPYRGNEYYRSQDDFILALAEAMRSRISGDRRGRVHPADRRRLAAGAVGPHRHGHGPPRVPQVLRGADRGAQSCPARPAGGPHSLSSVLGQLARPACLRHRARHSWST